MKKELTKFEQILGLIFLVFFAILMSVMSSRIDALEKNNKKLKIIVETQDKVIERIYDQQMNASSHP